MTVFDTKNTQKQYIFPKKTDNLYYEKSFSLRRNEGKKVLYLMEVSSLLSRKQKNGAPY